VYRPDTSLTCITLLVRVRERSRDLVGAYAGNFLQGDSTGEDSRAATMTFRSQCASRKSEKGAGFLRHRNWDDF
jgi:hypothetical protein